jgi:ribosomal protein L7/L12
MRFAMFDGMTEREIWMLLLAAIAVAFYLGRVSAGGSAETRARDRRVTQETAAVDFARLPQDTQSEVDRLLSAGKTIEAVKVVRQTLSTGLYEAKQIIDARKAGRAIS